MWYFQDITWTSTTKHHPLFSFHLVFCSNCSSQSSHTLSKGICYLASHVWKSARCKIFCPCYISQINCPMWIWSESFKHVFTFSPKVGCCGSSYVMHCSEILWVKLFLMSATAPTQAVETHKLDILLCPCSGTSKIALQRLSGLLLPAIVMDVCLYDYTRAHIFIHTYFTQMYFRSGCTLNYPSPARELDMHEKHRHVCTSSLSTI